MGRGHVYEELHATHRWAYGRQADAQLVDAVAELPRGPVLDLGGGQGRHALWLAGEGFDVEVVDSSPTALGQLRQQVAELQVDLSTTAGNVAFYSPSRSVCLVVGALVFHLLAPHAALRTARNCGQAVRKGGFFYLSVPGYDDETRSLATRLLREAGCPPAWCVHHLVTPQERPRLGVPRRNETRALGIKL